MPSDPSTSVPYGKLFEADIFLSSDTRSASSLWIRVSKTGSMVCVKVTVTHRSTAKTLAIFPTARILFLMTLRRSVESPPSSASMSSGSSSVASSSSSLEQVLRIAISMSVTDESHSAVNNPMEQIERTLLAHEW